MMIETGEQDDLAFEYGLQRFVYFDVETIPTQSAEVIEHIRATIKPPATLKKPESIAAWIAENGAEAAAEATLKTSFDGGRGHVCTIAWAKNNGEIKVRHAANIAEERAVIEAFFNDLDPYHSETIVGHNITGFDIPFLLKRAVVLWVKLPPAVSFPRDPKPWDKTVFDTMTAWSGAKDRISMDALCGIFGIQGKDGFDGSMVYPAWVAGEHDRIKEYCAADVSAVRQIHQRFMRAGW